MPRTTETLDSLFERQHGTLPDTFGVRPLSLSEGRMSMELTIAPWMMAPNGFLHAASQVMLADTCAGYASLAHLPEGAKGFTTLELKSNFSVPRNKASCGSRPWQNIWEGLHRCGRPPYSMTRGASCRCSAARRSFFGSGIQARQGRRRQGRKRSDRSTACPGTPSRCHARSCEEVTLTLAVGIDRDAGSGPQGRRPPPKKRPLPGRHSLLTRQRREASHRVWPGPGPRLLKPWLLVTAPAQTS